MACGTFRRESGGGVHRVVCCKVVGPVASHARRRRAGVLMGRSIRMTRGALERDMSSDKREQRLLMALTHVGNLPGLG